MNVLSGVIRTSPPRIFGYILLLWEPCFELPCYNSRIRSLILKYGLLDLSLLTSYPDDAGTSETAAFLTQPTSPTARHFSMSSSAPSFFSFLPMVSVWIRGKPPSSGLDWVLCWLVSRLVLSPLLPAGWPLATRVRRSTRRDVLRMESREEICLVSWNDPLEPFYC